MSSLIDGSHCYVIAEVGINHNGDLDLALRHVDMAADAGADAVKFQNFRTEDVLADRSLTYTYFSQGRQITESQWDMLKRVELASAQFTVIADYCRTRGIDFAATPSSYESVHDCVRLGAAFLKNGSDYIGHLPLIRAMAETGLPTILSTGMAAITEIEEAVEAYRDAGGKDLTLLHCVSLYPAPLDTLNLRRIPVLARRFECKVGFSDHSEGITATSAAVALGAKVIERHITLDKKLPGPDHWFSADPTELREMLTAIRATESALGSETLGFGEAEREARSLHRLSCVAARSLSAGTIVEKGDVTFRRPGTGLPPKSADTLMGRRVRSNVVQGHIFSLHDLEDT
jgi:N-acetylneuraminate synthase/N,N'-diacetyllegionaminate synthase